MVGIKTGVIPGWDVAGCERESAGGSSALAMVLATAAVASSPLDSSVVAGRLLILRRLSHSAREREERDLHSRLANRAGPD